MKRAAISFVLGVALLGLSPVQPADAAVQRHWGQALNVFGARLYACKAPEMTRHGLRWRMNLRVANNSRVKVVATAKVTRWIFHPSHNVTADSWARTVQRGASTPVGHVFAYDNSKKFADYVDLSLRRSGDGRALTWWTLYPRAIPRCSLSPNALSWQGAGRMGNHGGRMQLCANMFLDAHGTRTRWRFRGDATHALRALNYQAKIARVSDGQMRQQWSRTIPPGGYTPAGAMMHTMVIDPTTNTWEDGFDVAISEANTTDTSYGSGRGPTNIC